MSGAEDFDGGQLVRLFVDVLDRIEVGAARALVCDPHVALRRVSAPAVPDPWPPGGEWDNLAPEDRSRLYGLPEHAVRFEPFLTAPETHPTPTWQESRCPRPAKRSPPSPPRAAPAARAATAGDATTPYSTISPMRREATERPMVNAAIASGAVAAPSRPIHSTTSRSR